MILRKYGIGSLVFKCSCIRCTLQAEGNTEGVDQCLHLAVTHKVRVKIDGSTPGTQGNGIHRHTQGVIGGAVFLGDHDIAVVRVGACHHIARDRAYLAIGTVFNVVVGSLGVDHRNGDALRRRQCFHAEACQIQGHIFGRSNGSGILAQLQRILTGCFQSFLQGGETHTVYLCRRRRTCHQVCTVEVNFQRDVCDHDLTAADIRTCHGQVTNVCTAFEVAVKMQVQRAGIAVRQGNGICQLGGTSDTQQLDRGAAGQLHLTQAVNTTGIVGGIVHDATAGDSGVIEGQHTGGAHINVAAQLGGTAVGYRAVIEHGTAEIGNDAAARSVTAFIILIVHRYIIHLQLGAFLNIDGTTVIYSPVATGPEFACALDVQCAAAFDIDALVGNVPEVIQVDTDGLAVCNGLGSHGPVLREVVVTAGGHGLGAGGQGCPCNICLTVLAVCREGVILCIDSDGRDHHQQQNRRHK